VRAQAFFFFFSVLARLLLTTFLPPVDARIKPDLKVINAMLGCCARVEDKANGLKLLGLLVRSVRSYTHSALHLFPNGLAG
jgi:hypothetical protein